VSLSTKWRGPGGSPEQPDSEEPPGAADNEAPDAMSDAAQEESDPQGERLSGASLAQLVQAHSEVLEAEQRARHPQANPLAGPRLAAAKKVEQELLTGLGFLTFAEATASGFSAPAQRSADEGERDEATPASGELIEDSNAEAPSPAPDLSAVDEGADPNSRIEQKGDRLMDTPNDGGRSRFWSQEESVFKAAEPTARVQEQPAVPDELLTRLRASAAEFVDAEARRAQDTAAEIVESARIEAKASADLSRKLEETAAATAAATAGDLVSLLGLIDDLKAKLDATYGEVESRVELFRMASGKLQKPGLPR
jgi:hypothetical protein